MFKSQEIEILRETIAKLGPDSYCGPWLAGQLEAICSAIASDYPPEAYALSPSDAAREAQKIISEAKRERAEIISDAQNRAKADLQEAAKVIDNERASLRAFLVASLNRL